MERVDSVHGKEASGKQSERRDAPRLPRKVHFSTARMEGTGLIEDLSLSGANIAGTDCCPALGSRVRLSFATSDSQAPLYASGKVIRRRPFGFALRFEAVERSLQNLLLAAGSAGCARGD